MKFSEFLVGKSITEADFAKKDAEEMAALYNEYNEKKAADLQALVDAKASKEDIKTMLDEKAAEQAEAEFGVQHSEWRRQ